MVLGSFVSGLSGKVGKQVNLQTPQYLRQALTMALMVTEALKQERFAETFYAKLEKSVRISNRQDDKEFAKRHREGRGANRPRARKYTRKAENSGISSSVHDAHTVGKQGVTCAKGMGTWHGNILRGKNARKHRTPPEGKI
jgi:hypothetical protein